MVAWATLEAKVVTYQQQYLEDIGQKYLENLTRTRRWHGTPLGNNRTENQFRVMEFNLLADKLSGLYEAPNDKSFASPRDCLHFNLRKWMILEEICLYKPDLACFVELDKCEELMQSMKPLGYDVVFMKKFGAKKTDGTGLFYLKDKFDVVAFEGGPFMENGKECSQIYNVVRLQPKNQKLSAFNFAGIHLASKKSDDGEKLRKLQAEQILTILKERFSGCPTILTGDLNASHVVCMGTEPQAHPMIVNAGYESFYKQVCGEPEYTSWKTRAKGELKYTIDYIFSDKLKAISALGMIDPKYVPAERFPHYRYPSDHLSLVADFELPYKAV